MNDLPSTYRSLQRTGPDPVTEADVIVELLRRSTTLRRRLLVMTIAASLLGGAVGFAIYGVMSVRFFGRVAGLCFAAAALLVFSALRRVCGVLARRVEARWIRKLAARHQLDEGPLVEAAGMLE